MREGAGNGQSGLAWYNGDNYTQDSGHICIDGVNEHFCLCEAGFRNDTPKCSSYWERFNITNPFSDIEQAIATTVAAAINQSTNGTTVSPADVATTVATTIASLLSTTTTDAPTTSTAASGGNASAYTTPMATNGSAATTTAAGVADTTTTASAEDESTTAAASTTSGPQYPYPLLMQRHEGRDFAPDYSMGWRSGWAGQWSGLMNFIPDFRAADITHTTTYKTVYEMVMQGLVNQTINGSVQQVENWQNVSRVISEVLSTTWWDIEKNFLEGCVPDANYTTTCIEIDECKETPDVCGDPSVYQNECVDQVDGYDCHCGAPNDHPLTLGLPFNKDFQGFSIGVAQNPSLGRDTRGWPSNPCFHNLYGENKNNCSWVNNSIKYDCECSAGYVEEFASFSIQVPNATGPGTAPATHTSSLAFCADEDDCASSPCGPSWAGHKCYDQFQNYTCECRDWSIYQVELTPEQKPFCKGEYGCALNPCGTSAGETPHQCVDFNEQVYECSCAPGYRFEYVNIGYHNVSKVVCENVTLNQSIANSSHLSSGSAIFELVTLEQCSNKTVPVQNEITNLTAQTCTFIDMCEEKKIWNEALSNYTSPCGPAELGRVCHPRVNGYSCTCGNQEEVAGPRYINSLMPGNETCRSTAALFNIQEVLERENRECDWHKDLVLSKDGVGEVMDMTIPGSMPGYSSGNYFDECPHAFYRPESQCDSLGAMDEDQAYRPGNPTGCGFDPCYSPYHPQELGFTLRPENKARSEYHFSNAKVPEGLGKSTFVGLGSLFIRGMRITAHGSERAAIDSFMEMTKRYDEFYRYANTTREELRDYQYRVNLLDYLRAHNIQPCDFTHAKQYGSFDSAHDHSGPNSPLLNPVCFELIDVGVGPGWGAVSDYVNVPGSSVDGPTPKPVPESKGGDLQPFNGYELLEVSNPHVLAIHSPGWCSKDCWKDKIIRGIRRCGSSEQHNSVEYLDNLAVYTKEEDSSRVFNNQSLIQELTCWEEKQWTNQAAGNVTVNQLTFHNIDTLQKNWPSWSNWTDLLYGFPECPSMNVTEHHLVPFDISPYTTTTTTSTTTVPGITQEECARVGGILQEHPCNPQNSDVTFPQGHQPFTSCYMPPPANHSHKGTCSISMAGLSHAYAGEYSGHHTNSSYLRTLRRLAGHYNTSSNHSSNHSGHQNQSQQHHQEEEEDYPTTCREVCAATGFTCQEGFQGPDWSTCHCKAEVYQMRIQSFSCSADFRNLTLSHPEQLDELHCRCGGILPPQTNSTPPAPPQIPSHVLKVPDPKTTHLNVSEWEYMYFTNESRVVLKPSTPPGLQQNLCWVREEQPRYTGQVLLGEGPEPPQYPHSPPPSDAPVEYHIAYEEEKENWLHGLVGKPIPGKESILTFYGQWKCQGFQSCRCDDLCHSKYFDCCLKCSPKEDLVEEGCSFQPMVRNRFRTCTTGMRTEDGDFVEIGSAENTESDSIPCIQMQPDSEYPSILVENINLAAYQLDNFENVSISTTMISGAPVQVIEKHDTSVPTPWLESEVADPRLKVANLGSKHWIDGGPRHKPYTKPCGRYDHDCVDVDDLSKLFYKDLKHCSEFSAREYQHGDWDRMMNLLVCWEFNELQYIDAFPVNISTLRNASEIKRLGVVPNHMLTDMNPSGVYPGMPNWRPAEVVWIKDHYRSPRGFKVGTSYNGEEKGRTEVFDYLLSELLRDYQHLLSRALYDDDVIAYNRQKLIGEGKIPAMLRQWHNNSIIIKAPFFCGKPCWSDNLVRGYEKCCSDAGGFSREGDQQTAVDMAQYAEGVRLFERDQSVKRWEQLKNSIVEGEEYMKTHNGSLMGWVYTGPDLPQSSEEERNLMDGDDQSNEQHREYRRMLAGGHQPERPNMGKSSLSFPRLRLN